MIRSKNELIEYLQKDRLAMGKKNKFPRLFGDLIWKYLITLRITEYFSNCTKTPIGKMVLIILRVIRHVQGQKTGFEIGLNQCGPGIAIAHTGKVIFHKNARVGSNCRIVTDITLGATNGSECAPQIGDNVFISVGARIIGNVIIADDVAIAANAVVTKSILEKGTTWGGVPAKKISDNSSKSNYPYLE